MVRQAKGKASAKAIHKKKRIPIDPFSQENILKSTFWNQPNSHQKSLQKSSKKSFWHFPKRRKRRRTFGKNLKKIALDTLSGNPSKVLRKVFHSTTHALKSPIHSRHSPSFHHSVLLPSTPLPPVYNNPLRMAYPPPSGLFVILPPDQFTSLAIFQTTAPPLNIRGWYYESLGGLFQALW